MIDMSLVTLEQNVPLSASLLWKYQREYFTKKGINAWANGEVPFYVTSNVLIAYCYAQFALRFIQDNLKNNTINPEKPIYFTELGSGSGKISFLFLQKLTEFLKTYHLDHLKICYVITDFTENNLAFWESHPNFKEYLAQGILDFAIFQIGTKNDLHLVHHNITLGENSCENPIIAIGNYIFDTVEHDSFRIQNNTLEEGVVTTKTPEDNIQGDGIGSLDRLMTDFYYRKIELPYYNNSAMDDILQYYATTIQNGSFLAPIGAVKCIDNLRRLCNNRLLLISGDKGYSSLESLKNLGTPHIAFHGSFSMMVNFDFIGRYFVNIGGDALVAEDHDGMKISMFCLGQKFSDLIETSWANEQFNTHLSTKEFLEIKNFLIRDIFDLTLEQIIALLKFSYWDSDIFYSVSPQLIRLVGQASPELLTILRQGLKEIERVYYYIRNVKNIPLELAHVYMQMRDYDDAIYHYQKTIEWFSESSSIYFDMALCHYFNNNSVKALEYFQKVLALNPDNEEAKVWAGRISAELNPSTSEDTTK